MDWIYFIIWLGLLLFIIMKVGVWLDAFKRGVGLIFTGPSLQERIQILQNQYDNLGDIIEQDDMNFFTKEALKHGR